ncbi:hypothetical protein BDN71DRAFT_1497147 [Pleurotus eryngii]|uniref:Uncharacterized protein n=1 Tax=Pleurotus eryngii TaxID=5323 RepID=A0A9P6D6N4_PLEER|nr:hypothetical protein BDN71DRAFT_1497147 [Pleurotus eryngii]
MDVSSGERRRNRVYFSVAKLAHPVMSKRFAKTTEGADLLRVSKLPQWGVGKVIYGVGRHSPSHKWSATQFVRQVCNQPGVGGQHDANGDHYTELNHSSIDADGGTGSNGMRRTGQDVVSRFSYQLTRTHTLLSEGLQRRENRRAERESSPTNKADAMGESIPAGPSRSRINELDRRFAVYSQRLDCHPLDIEVGPQPSFAVGCVQNERAGGRIYQTLNSTP